MDRAVILLLLYDCWRIFLLYRHIFIHELSTSKLGGQKFLAWVMMKRLQKDVEPPCQTLKQPYSVLSQCNAVRIVVWWCREYASKAMLKTKNVYALQVHQYLITISFYLNYLQTSWESTAYSKVFNCLALQCNSENNIKKWKKHLK